MSAVGNDAEAPDGRLKQVGLAVRVPLLALCVVLAAFAESGDRPVAVATGLLTATGSAAAVLPQVGSAGRLVRIAEAVVWAACVVATGTSDSALLPYLLAPAFLGGLVEGSRAAVVVPGVAAATLLAGNAAFPAGPPLQDFAAESAQWVVLGVAVAAVGAWVQHQRHTPPQDEPRAAQEAAHRLLVQLRAVSRRLPGTLSPAATAENLLIGLRDVMPVERGAVVVSTGGRRLVPLAYVGGETLDWQIELAADSGIAEAWASQVPIVRDRQHVRAHGATPTGSCLAVPLTLGRRTFGVVALESSVRGAYDARAVTTAAERADDVALPLDTGLLFDEIRSVATAEERQRVAREIHDGIAQELVYLGYALDNAIADCEGRGVQQSLLDVRAEVARVVGELRMSLFDLRSAVDPQAGLGAALGEHVRSVGTRSGMTVHLSLTESTLRLPPDTEAELLRIAQEAIANARKHADASNLWVSYEVDPPFAVLVVEDDGRGLAQQPDGDRYGMRIMRERAERIRGVLDVGPRAEGGTRVRVRLDGVAARPVVPDDDAAAVRPL